MTELQIGFFGLGALLVLIALRVPVGFALMLVAMFGIAQLKGWSVAAGMLTSLAIMPDCEKTTLVNPGSVAISTV